MVPEQQDDAPLNLLGSLQYDLDNVGEVRFAEGQSVFVEVSTLQQREEELDRARTRGCKQQLGAYKGYQRTCSRGEQLA